LIGRAHSTLPGRKPSAKKSAVKGVVSTLGSAKRSALARKPSKKGVVGILAGGLGLGVAATAKRRRGSSQDDMSTTPPVQPVEASGERTDSLAPRPSQNLTPTGQGGIVEIPKEQILQMLRERGNHDQAQQADQQLPDQVDPEQHKDLLGRLGIDPGQILGGLGGKLGL
jgi:hypothetical protein